VHGPKVNAGRRAERPARVARHDWRRATVDLPAFAASGLASDTMGRGLAEDPLFFGAALAGGAALAELVGEGAGGEGADRGVGGADEAASGS